MWPVSRRMHSRRRQIKSFFMANAQIFSASSLKFFWNTCRRMPKTHKSRDYGRHLKQQTSSYLHHLAFQENKTLNVEHLFHADLSTGNIKIRYLVKYWNVTAPYCDISGTKCCSHRRPYALYFPAIYRIVYCSNTMLPHSPKYHPKSRRAVGRAVQIINGPLHLSAFGNVNNGTKRNMTQQMWIRLLGAGAACDPECYSLPKVITIQKNTTYQQNLGWTHSACECFRNQVLLLHTVVLPNQVPGMFQGLSQCMDPGHQHTLCLQPSHSLTQWERGCDVFTCQQILKHNGTQMHILPCNIELVHCETTLFISESQCIIDKWLPSTVLNFLNTPNKIICKCTSLIPVVSTVRLLRQHHNIISVGEDKLNNTMWEHSAQLFHTDSWSWAILRSA